MLEVDSPTCALRADGWEEEKAFGAPHALQAQARSASHPKAGKAISTQTCTHPTQVRMPARRVTYVSSPCTVPNCRHTPAPVTHPKWTSAHPRGMQATQIGARVRLPFLFLRVLFLSLFCPTTITLATKELSRLAPASQFLLKPGWRPAHDKAGEPGSRQLSGGGGAAKSVRALLSRVSPSPPLPPSWCHSTRRRPQGAQRAHCTAPDPGGGAAGLMVPGRGAPGVFPSPLAGPDRNRPLGARSNRDPGAPPGGVLGHPVGADRQGAARSRAAQALGSAAAAAAPAVGDPEQLQPRAAHLGARTWPEPRAMSGTLTPEHVLRSPPPGSPVPAPPGVRIRPCAASEEKNNLQIPGNRAAT